MPIIRANEVPKPYSPTQKSLKYMIYGAILEFLMKKNDIRK
jgi:hypothetical protein